MISKLPKLQHVLVVLFALTFSSCATILSGSRQYIFVETYPGNAIITRNGEFLGTTPLLIRIERNSKAPLEVSHPGYESQVIYLKRKINPFVFLNFGNPLGYKIDLMSGGSFRFEKSYYIRSLSYKSEQQVCAEVNTFADEDKLPDAIFWNEKRKLAEGDFRGSTVPGDDRYYAAGTVATISCEYILSDSSSLVIITPVFSAAFSFLKAGKNKTVTILRHEQIHFDITEIYARKIRQQLSSGFFGRESFRQKMNSICFNLMQEMEAYQAFFDEETCNAPSADEMEKKWMKKIEQELIDLDKYKEEKFCIPFSKNAGG